MGINYCGDWRSLFLLWCHSQTWETPFSRVEGQFIICGLLSQWTDQKKRQKTQEWCVRDMLVPHTARDVLTPPRCRRLLIWAPYEPHSLLHRNHILIIHCDCQGILLGFCLINCQGKVKRSARCPTFSLTGFPRAFLILQPWDFFLTTSRPAPTGIEGRGITPSSLRRGWRGAGFVAAMLGDCLASYLLYICTYLNNHSQNTTKTGNWLEICAFDLQLGPLNENTG